MAGRGGALLEYQLRQTSGGAALSQIFVEVVMVLGSGSATVPIFADILSPSVQRPTGSYNATYGSGGTNGVEMRLGVLLCNLLGQELAAGGFAVRSVAASSRDVSTTATKPRRSALIPTVLWSPSPIEQCPVAGTAPNVPLRPRWGRDRRASGRRGLPSPAGRNCRWHRARCAQNDPDRCA